MKILSTLAAAAFIQTSAIATDITTQKLTGHWSHTPANYQLGGSGLPSTHQLACNEKWIIAGAPAASEQANGQGAAQVFNTVSGAWVRKLLPPGAAVANTAFGAAVALSGDLGLVSSENTKVHVFNLSTGKLVRTLQLPLPTSATITSIAVAGTRAVVGAPAASSPGTVFFFDLNTGALMGARHASDSANGDGFGTSVAADGGLCVVGAPGLAAYVIELDSFTQVREYQTPHPTIVDDFGHSVAIDQGIIAIGAPGSDLDSDGSVLVIDLFTGAQSEQIIQNTFGGQHHGLSVAMHQGQLLAGGYSVYADPSVYAFGLSSGDFTQLNAPEISFSIQRFGSPVALCGTTAVVAIPLDDTQAVNAGALCVFRNVQCRMPVFKWVAKGDYAPGAADISFATLGECYSTPLGSAFVSTLSGAGSNGGKDSGLWVNAGGFRLAHKTRDIEGGSTITAITNLRSCNPAAVLYQAKLGGTGVNSSNNQAIYRHGAAGNSLVYRTGSALGALNNAQPLAFTQTVQTAIANQMAVACSLRQIAGNTTANNDSAVLLHDVATVVTEAVREGSAAGSTGYTYGQFAGRVAAAGQSVFYPTTVTAPGFAGQAVFQKSFGNAEGVLALTNTSAPQLNGFVFASFVGETSNQNNGLLVRATARTTTAPIVNTEGLWTFNVNGITPQRIIVKGDTVAGGGGARVAKILTFWQVPAGTLTLVQLTGTGVSAANDQALLLTSIDGSTTQILMREGEAAPGCNGATIGTITRVEVEPFLGSYLVLTTLAGAPATANLALFRGLSSYPSVTTADTVFRKPVRVLRKGQLFSNQSGSIKSITLPASNLTAAGAGGTGIGSAISKPANGTTMGNCSIIIEFDNGVRQIMTGMF